MSASQKISAEVFADMPSDWPTYIESQPDVLPDYRPFAHEVIDLVDRTPRGEIPTLLGPNNIGKTRLLIPAIAEMALQQGYDYRGSIGGGAMGILGTKVMLNAHEWLVEKGRGLGLDKDRWGNPQVLFPGHHSEHSQRYYEFMERAVRRAIRPGDRTGLYIIDEVALFTWKYPELLHYMSQVTQENNIKIVALAPMIDRRQADTSEQEEIASREVSTLKGLAEITDATVLPVQITEQCIAMEAVQKIFQVYKMQPKLAEPFERNSSLRRLGTVEEVVEILAGRYKAHLIMEGDKLVKKVLFDDSVLGRDAFRKLVELRQGSRLDPSKLNDEYDLIQCAAMTGLPHSAHRAMIDELYSET